MSMEWKPDGTAIAVGTWGGNVLIWDVKSGQLTFEQRGNDYQGSDPYLSFIQGLHFNPDGSELTSVSRDGTVQTWDIATGQRLVDTKLPSPIYAVDWSPDGNKLAYGGDDTSIQIVEVADLLTTPTAAPEP